MSSEPADQHELSSPVKQFCSYTSAHGLGRFSEQSSFIGRSLWLTFLLATYSGFGYHLYTLFDRYQQAPVLTTITVSTLPYQFPDVYICPTHAVTMSRIVPMLSTSDIYNVELGSKSNTSEKIKLYDFDLSKSETLFFNKPTQAFLIALEQTESAVMSQLKLLVKSKNKSSDCRRSLDGSNYLGNASYAVVYGPSSITIDPSDSKTLGNYSVKPPVQPYVIYKQCMRWNDAARMLQRGSSNAEVLGGLLMKLNFSETESRCRLPPGLPLTEFLPIATRPRREIIGCFPVTADTAFNITCYSGGLEAFEPCAQCCDKFNAPFAALLNRGDCLCGSSEAAATLADGSWTSCDRQCGNSKTEPCGSDRTAAVMIIRDVGGPYCFFMDSERLNAGLCDVPYCAATKEFDCAVSKNAGANVVYTGRTNWTESGRDCLPWSSVENVQMKMKLNKGVRFVEKLLRLKIQTPDRIGNTSDNFCRPVSIVIDLAETENGTFTRHPVLISNSPVCFADPSLLHTMSVPIFQTQFFEMAFERCTIPTCSAETSVRGVFTDSVGSHLLARQFSNDLSIGLADCTFAGQKCTKEHFVNIDHPQLGMCHQFLKQSFIANMSSTQLAGSQLSITYFTDSTDSKGKTVEDMPEMTSAFHNGMSLEISDLAFKVSG
uniref:WSC domain-containing protein n=1 Tax=Macrostomum lignano TaxID=282301 RepID=A0A1I8HN37_9PLAT